jgi:serine protease
MLLTACGGGDTSEGPRARPLAVSAGSTATDAASVASARVIVAWREDAGTARAHPWRRGAGAAEVRVASARRAESLGRRQGLELQTGRVVGQRAQVVMAKGLDSAALARRLASDPDVAWAVADQRRRALAAPNDPLFSASPAVNLTSQTGGPEVGQWYLRAPTDLFRSATNAEAAWTKSIGTGIVVAVLDTGVWYGHADLQGQLLPGYDMVRDSNYANDGGGRDADASDPGDWVTTEENVSGIYKDCGQEDSSWHGTKVAGIIAAATNNQIGMAGMAPGAKVLPVRVLGKCGGFDSDITAGMLWAAGIEQPGLPVNPHPARVLNMSLGGEGGCSAAYQEAVSAVTARGVVVVAAAGNSAGRAVGSPANCPGVMAVAGLRHAGSKVGFSDLGPEIAIAAPGGNCVNIEQGSPCLYPILTASNSGLREPVAGGSSYTDSFKRSVGTSFATPMVAATAALVLTLRPDWGPQQVRQAITSTARPFPTSGADNGTDPTPVATCKAPSTTEQLQCYCVTGLCGAGMLDVQAAVTAAQPPTDGREDLYRFFAIAFNAAPGVTYMEQLLQAAGAGLSVKEIVNIFTTKAQFLETYPARLSDQEFAQKLADNVVGTSASAAAKAEAVADIVKALSPPANWTRGDITYTIFSNLAQMPANDPKWGGMARKMANQVAYARHFTATLKVDTTYIPALRAVLRDVTEASSTATVDMGARIQGTLSALSPGVGSITVDTLGYGQTATFTVDGANMNKGVTLAVSGCETAVPSQVASLWRHTFTCKPGPALSITAQALLNGAALTSQTFTVPKPQVRLNTSLGAVVVELEPGKVRATVDNYLAYVDARFYDGTIFHRIARNYVVQGGGFTAVFGATLLQQSGLRVAIPLETNKGLSNLRGTIAMARTSLPDTATSQFYLNAVDNTFLDFSSAALPGYAVFGSVVSGLGVIDAMNAVATRTVGPYADVPVNDVVLTTAVRVK